MDDDALARIFRSAIVLDSRLIGTPSPSVKRKSQAKPNSNRPIRITSHSLKQFVHARQIHQLMRLSRFVCSRMIHAMANQRSTRNTFCLFLFLYEKCLTSSQAKTVLLLLTENALTKRYRECHRNQFHCLPVYTRSFDSNEIDALFILAVDTMLRLRNCADMRCRACSNVFDNVRPCPSCESEFHNMSCTFTARCPCHYFTIIVHKLRLLNDHRRSIPCRRHQNVQD